MNDARIYVRRNGELGSSCDGTQDTGHTIIEEDGKFTVWSDEDPDHAIIFDATKKEAEEAIARDWRGARKRGH